MRISVDLRWTSFLVSAFLITAAQAAPGDKIELVRDLAGRVGPVIGSALACPDITRPRIQSVIEKFAAVIRDAASNEAQRSDLAQLIDCVVRVDGVSAHSNREGSRCRSRMEQEEHLATPANPESPYESCCAKTAIWRGCSRIC